MKASRLKTWLLIALAYGSWFLGVKLLDVSGADGYLPLFFGSVILGIFILGTRSMPTVTEDMSDDIDIELRKMTDAK